MLRIIFFKIFIFFHHTQFNKWKNKSIINQHKWLKYLISKAKDTEFGKDHHFNKIHDYEDFKKMVPVKDYEGIRHYIEKVKEGKGNILWVKKPLYFAKTSGTTSGTKYIPISKESMPYHIKGAKNALFNYIFLSKYYDILTGKMIFIQGSPRLTSKNGINIGRLSGIVAHFVPSYLQKNRLPSWETNCIEDWETKVNKIIEETRGENMTVIGGIPPWILMYFEKLKHKTKQNISQLFPNLKVLITGGVNYAPYQEVIDNLIGKKIDIVQIFPASEGFFAFQDQLNDDSLLLMTNHGIFYEFIPMEEYGKENPTRLQLSEIELDKDYALIISTNAGLWAYDIGDTVRFVSKNPYRLIVTGRTKHYTSAFGEHVIAYEVEEAMKKAIQTFNLKIIEFTLAPQVTPENNELPYHEWFIEFDEIPPNMSEIEAFLDMEMRQLNSYYEDLITGTILRPLKISIVERGGFNKMMENNGKLGGQNKIPRLSNNRNIADQMEAFVI